MSILAECPFCHRKQATKNKRCVCGAELDQLKRSKKVKYWISYRLPGGKQCREKIGTSIEEARDAMGKRRVQKREGRIFDIRADTKMTFNNLIQWYLALEKVKKTKSKREIEIRLKNFNSEYGNVTLRNIKPVDIENFQVKRKNEGLSNSYIDDIRGAVRTMVKTAFENYLISGEPLRTFTAVKKLLKRNSNARDRILSPEEFKGLSGKAEIHLKPIIAMGYYTGMRKGEILGLTWDKINLKNRLICLEASDTKDSEPRLIPICNELHKMLKVIPRAIHDTHVFLYKGRLIGDIKTSLKTACKGAGIAYGRNVKGGFIFHDLRHAFNTNARKAGIDQHTIMAITGHATREMFDRYDTIDLEDIKAAVNRLEVFFRNGDQTVDQIIKRT